MTPNLFEAVSADDAPRATPVRISPAGWSAAVCAAAVIAAGWLGAQGWWWACGTICLISSFLISRLAAGPRNGSPLADGKASDAPSAQTHLVEQVVPVWRRNMEAARSHSERSMNALLENFSSISSHLDHALGRHGDSPILEVDAIDALLNSNKPHLDKLLNSTRLAVDVKEEMAQGVSEMSGQLAELVKLSKEVQTIGRATHLLAMNASVEATRSGGKSSGIGVVALEVQRLAAMSREAGTQIVKRVHTMQERMDALKWRARRHDTGEDEILLQAEENARAVMAQLISSVADVTRSSRSIRNANRDVQTELDKIFVGLQSQDRLSQMMASVTDDMQRLSAWLAGARDEAGLSARDWLDRLEASYTMEELRASHHDTVSVDKSTGVEFF